MSERILSGRVALVTGVSRRKGIGFAIAQRLSMLGADIFMHSFTPYDAEREWGADPDGIAALIATLQENGTQIFHAEGDFLDPATPGKILDAAVQALGQIDIIVANPQGRWGEPEDAARVIGWLATDDARWITGQIINSTGGGY